MTCAASFARQREGHPHPASYFLLSACVALLAWAGAALGQTEAGRRAPPLDAQTDAQWLHAIQGAAHRLSYSGTVVYQQGDLVRMTRLIHSFDGRSTYERLQPLDGTPREFIRNGDEVQCLLPEARRVVIERRGARDSFPAITDTDPAAILAHYTLRLGSVERVAGLECQVILVEPKDKLRFGYRLWVDRSTGLLLRAQTLNERGEVLEQMAFADIRIGDRIERAMLKPSWSTEGWRVERTDQRATDLGKHGWRISPPAGFRKSREVARVLHGSTVGSHEAMQAVYSDGLASVSVFVEPATAEAATEASQSNGPTNAYTRRVGDSRVTVVGEVPLETVKSMAQSVEFRP
jgi:sigma-E factor negative regulatory protein RseB